MKSAILKTGSPLAGNGIRVESPVGLFVINLSGVRVPPPALVLSQRLNIPKNLSLGWSLPVGADSQEIFHHDSQRNITNHTEAAA